MRSVISRLVIGSLAFLGVVGSAAADSFTATITADNHYALYVGGENGEGLTFIGRNEIGGGGAPGEFNWSQAEVWNFNAGPDQYIYILAWSDDQIAQGLIGTIVNNTIADTFHTNNVEWEVYLTNNDLDSADAAPTAAALAPTVAAAVWGSINGTRDHGAAPWGLIAGISPFADWIWTGEQGDPDPFEPGSAFGEAQLYRIPSGATVPEPASMALLGAGLAGVAARRRKRA